MKWHLTDITEYGRPGMPTDMVKRREEANYAGKVYSLDRIKDDGYLAGGEKGWLWLWTEHDGVFIEDKFGIYLGADTQWGYYELDGPCISMWIGEDTDYDARPDFVIGGKDGSTLYDADEDIEAFWQSEQE